MAFLVLFRRWMVAAILLIPGWLALGLVIVHPGVWSVLGAAFVLPITVLVLIGLTALVLVRPSVRATRAVTWRDVVWYGLWQLVLIRIGCWGPDAVALTVVAAVGAVALCGYAVQRLFRDTLAGVRAAGGTGPPARPADPEVIVVRETRDDT